MEFPLVTIGVASYNNGLYLRETLESIRLQTYPHIELIIVDDASRDDSVAVAEAWLAEFPQVQAQLIRHETNLGVCRTFNDVVELARGEFVCIIGSDDVYLPDKILIQVKELEEASSDYGVVYSNIYYMDEFGNTTGETSIDKDHLAEDAIDKLIIANSIPAMSVLVKKSCYERVGVYDEKLVFEDADMWLRIAKEYKFLFSDYISAKYRKHSLAVSSNWDKNYKFLNSIAIMLNKNLGFSNKRDEIIKTRISELAERMYYAGGGESTYWLKKRWESDKKVNSFLLLAMSRLGIPGKWVLELQRVLGRL